jgi:hypothetical protein
MPGRDLRLGSHKNLFDARRFHAPTIGTVKRVQPNYPRWGSDC